ncbi:hypothetical protein OG883_17200 [Streptomyces sp. NBC_01142]|uniref:hypothetical protein n=1 Tax=Streptomyces sp. NBC_01142 TaxID=2975865 RepID=UPI002250780D|nr:hypothetical protein [Streptomyces sp. NBC_01142]MCX4821596.1 hypothetical protein [Streptomyces sp. NBC_01142]
MILVSWYINGSTGHRLAAGVAEARNAVSVALDTESATAEVAAEDPLEALALFLASDARTLLDESGLAAFRADEPGLNLLVSLARL